jgi:hypothetical protein
MWLKKMGRDSEAKGYLFSPSGWVGDSGGGQWLALRLVYNTHLPIENRGSVAVTDTVTGKALEIDCDLHFEMDLGRMMKKTDDSFDEEVWLELVKEWHSNSLTAKNLQEATFNMEGFINMQTNKEVVRMCKAWMDFYASERTLHLYRQPQMNKVEVLQHSDKLIMGKMLALPTWAQQQITSLILQASKLEFIARGGEVRVWTSPAVEQRRDEYYHRTQGTQQAEDILAQISELHQVCFCKGIISWVWH